jgi:phosphatidylserine decarboxylase
MSPLNVHVTRYPFNGKVLYSQYHHGKYLVAWHPKSSTHNERTTVVIEHPSGEPILYRQIAGALARRIVNYAKVGDTVKAGEDAGFIKFGSRIDVIIPNDAKINVSLDQKVKGGETIIAELLK